MSSEEDRKELGHVECEKQIGDVESEKQIGEVIDVGGEDDAAKYAGLAHQPLDAATNRKLRTKADMFVCSLMAFVYAIQFMDKVSNAAAAILGMREDLDMLGANAEKHPYSWVGSSFYLGYLVFEIPVSFVLQKYPLGKATGLFIISWGIVLTCSAASQEYAGYITTRTLLGILEGAVTPSFVLFTSQYYRREEQFARTCMWFGMNGIGSILGSSIAIGLYKHQHHYSVAAWRILFIVMGLMTVVLGVVFFFYVPDNPNKAWFFNEEEKALMVERIRDNKQGYGNHKIKWDQIKEVAIDPRSYLYFALNFVGDVPNGGLTNFQTILYQGMNFSTLKTFELGIAGGAVEFVGCFGVGLLSHYVWKHFRMGYAILGAAVTLACMCMLAYGKTNQPQMAGIMLFSWASPISYIGLLSSISSNSAGSTKKSLMSAILLIGYCVGNLVGPQTFKSSEDPHYSTAKTAMVSCSAVYLGLIIALLALNVFENKRRDRKNEKLDPSFVNSEFADLTDFQNPEFRYAL